MYWLNSLMPGVVKLKYEFSYTRIVFLDLEIFLEDGKLRTSLFVKPSNKQIFLDFHSNHPTPCIESIPYSQALRAVERCAIPEDREQKLSDLKEEFIDRNYPSQLVDKQFNRARTKDRKALIGQARKPRDQADSKVRFVFTHNQSNPPIHMWVREGQKLLARNDNAKDVGRRIQICSKQPKNIQKIIGEIEGGLGATGIPPLKQVARNV